jgi:hypothetical protein
LGIKTVSLPGLSDLAVDRQRPAFVDPLAESEIAALEFKDETTGLVRHHLGQPTGSPAGCLT